jgi:hypothetical protein
MNMSVRNRDLKTVSKVVTSTASAINLGGQVPAGMKRWVTFLELDTSLATGASQVGIYLASVGVSNPTRASLIATGNRKGLFFLRATQTSGARDTPLRVPKIPNPETPLFSIASGKWLGVMATATTALVKVGFFDE